MRGAAALLDLLLPRTCVLCDRPLGETEREIACSICWGAVRLLPEPRCERCGHPRPHRFSCGWCTLLPPYVRAARSVAWVPDGIAGALVHALKYERWTALAAPMAVRMARLDYPPDVRAERAAVVPVPLAPGRLRERGFNQSLLLARVLGACWSVPVLEPLERTRSTASQTRLTPADRRLNVAGAFGVAPRGGGELVAGRHVVLVDDVITTAATLNAAAATLFAQGARIISYVTFGRARDAGNAGFQG